MQRPLNTKTGPGASDVQNGSQRRRCRTTLTASALQSVSPSGGDRAVCGRAVHPAQSGVADGKEGFIAYFEEAGRDYPVCRRLWRRLPKMGPSPPRTAQRTAASARRDAVGVIYPDLPRLTRLNLPPINAADYLISWQRLLGSLGKGIGGCALRPQLDRGPPCS